MGRSRPPLALFQIVAEQLHDQKSRPLLIGVIPDYFVIDARLEDRAL
jgi:hypothetical protein